MEGSKNRKGGDGEVVALGLDKKRKRLRMSLFLVSLFYVYAPAGLAALGATSSVSFSIATFRS